MRRRLNPLDCLYKDGPKSRLTLDSGFGKPVENALIASTGQVGRPEIDNDPAHQQGQDIEREPFNARPF